MTSTVETLLQVLILVAVGVAFVTDLRRRRVYNALTFPMMAAGLVLNTVRDFPMGLVWAAAGLALGGALFFVPVALGGMGAGDLKLLAALGALGGPTFVFWCALYASVAGGIFAVIALVLSKRFTSVVGGMVLDVMTSMYTHQGPRATSNMRIPYAVPIAFGAVAALALR